MNDILREVVTEAIAKRFQEEQDRFDDLQNQIETSQRKLEDIQNAINTHKLKADNQARQQKIKDAAEEKKLKGIEQLFLWMESEENWVVFSNWHGLHIKQIKDIRCSYEKANPVACFMRMGYESIFILEIGSYSDSSGNNREQAHVFRTEQEAVDFVFKETEQTKQYAKACDVFKKYNLQSKEYGEWLDKQTEMKKSQLLEAVQKQRKQLADVEKRLVNLCKGFTE